MYNGGGDNRLVPLYTFSLEKKNQIVQHKKMLLDGKR